MAILYCPFKTCFLFYIISVLFIEIKLKNNVASQNFLKVIMALETLFMEWSCDERVQESLILVGVVYLLFQQLELLQRLLNVDKIMKKVYICFHYYLYVNLLWASYYVMC